MLGIKIINKDIKISNLRMCAVLSSENEVYAWGNNTMGQCGQGHTSTPITKPKKVLGLEGVSIQQITAGTSHSLAWTAVPTDRWGLKCVWNKFNYLFSYADLPCTQWSFNNYFCAMSVFSYSIPHCEHMWFASLCCSISVQGTAAWLYKKIWLWLFGHAYIKL